MASRIEDYALLGDCHTAALVSRAGSVDWLCLPRFDSPACFAALLGTPDNGRWLLAPVAAVRRVERRYRGDSFVLETDHFTDGGAVRVVDCMPVRDGRFDLVRVVTGLSGRVRVRCEVEFRFDYGSAIPWVTREDGGVRAVAGPDAVHLRTSVELHGEGLKTVGEFDVAEGQTVSFSLNWHPSHEDPPPPVDPLAAVQATFEWWQRWAATCSFRGNHRDAVVRSLAVLKALTYAPTGGVVAAATTSLPEALGDGRNWDYRFCWLRDATLTLVAMVRAGFTDEARAWRCWLARAVAGSPEQIQPVYSVTGERRLPESQADWLAGYENSRPVRLGNGAAEQFQLDVHGEVISALHLAREAGVDGDGTDWCVQRAITDHLETVWRTADRGIWEVRGPDRHFTHSKVMAWVAFDRAVKAVEHFGLDGPVERWRKLRDEVHAEVCDKGFDRRLNSFVQYYGGRDFDASLLALPLVGFLPATDPRVLGTVAAVEKHLTRDDFVSRYECSHGVDGFTSCEGRFLLCTFWLADNYTLSGRRADARRVFEKLLTIRNDVGLLAEQYDPASRRQLGNFPQAFSHTGLVNSALRLAGEVPQG